MKNLMQLLKQKNFKISDTLTSIAHNSFENERLSYSTYEVELSTKDYDHFLIEFEMSVHYHPNREDWGVECNPVIDHVTIKEITFITKDSETSISMEQIEENEHEIIEILKDK